MAEGLSIKTKREHRTITVDDKQFHIREAREVTLSEKVALINVLRDMGRLGDAVKAKVDPEEMRPVSAALLDAMKVVSPELAADAVSGAMSDDERAQVLNYFFSAQSRPGAEGDEKKTPAASC